MGPAVDRPVVDEDMVRIAARRARIGEGDGIEAVGRIDGRRHPRQVGLVDQAPELVVDPLLADGRDLRPALQHEEAGAVAEEDEIAVGGERARDRRAEIVRDLGEPEDQRRPLIARPPDRELLEDDGGIFDADQPLDPAAVGQVLLARLGLLRGDPIRGIVDRRPLHPAARPALIAGHHEIAGDAGIERGRRRAGQGRESGVRLDVEDLRRIEAVEGQDVRAELDEGPDPVGERGIGPAHGPAHIGEARARQPVELGRIAGEDDAGAIGLAHEDRPLAARAQRARHRGEAREGPIAARGRDDVQRLAGAAAREIRRIGLPGSDRDHGLHTPVEGRFDVGLYRVGGDPISVA